MIKCISLLLKLALDKYQIRSAKGIKRFWLISSLACLIACSESENFDFSEGYHILTKKIETEQLENLFLAAKNCDDFEAFKDLVAQCILTMNLKFAHL